MSETMMEFHHWKLLFWNQITMLQMILSNVELFMITRQKYNSDTEQK